MVQDKTPRRQGFEDDEARGNQGTQGGGERGRGVKGERNRGEEIDNLDRDGDLDEQEEMDRDSER